MRKRTRLKRSEHSPRDVPRRDARERERHQRRGHQPPAIRGAQEPEQREYHGDERHEDELRAGADAHGEPRGRTRRPEDVAVEQLPPALVLRVVP